MVLSVGCFSEAGNDHLDRREFAQEHSTHSLLKQLALGTGPVVEIWYDFAIDKIDNYHVYMDFLLHYGLLVVKAVFPIEFCYRFRGRAGHEFYIFPFSART